MPHFERKRAEMKRSEPAIDIKPAYERARKINDRESIDPRKFEHYDKTMILRDMELVQRREADFRMQSSPESEENKKLAIILEAILHEQIGISDWIGPNVSTIKASRFDDIVNGVDSIARIQREGEGDTHLGLAIDVTFSSHITDKLDRIKDDVKNGTLTQIKYFASPNPEDPKEHTYMGSLKVPRVVIGIEKKAVYDLMKQWMDNNKKELAQNPIQHVIASEVVEQLSFFERYARSRNQPAIAAVYKQVRSVVERSLAEKEDGVWQKDRNRNKETEAMQGLKNDRVRKAIEDYMRDVEETEIKDLKA